MGGIDKCWVHCIFNCFIIILFVLVLCVYNLMRKTKQIVHVLDTMSKLNIHKDKKNYLGLWYISDRQDVLIIRRITVMLWQKQEILIIYGDTWFLIMSYLSSFPYKLVVQIIILQLLVSAKFTTNYTVFNNNCVY